MKAPFYLVLDLETIVDPEFQDQTTDKNNKPRFPPPACHQILCAGFMFLDAHRPQEMGVLLGGESEILDKLVSSIHHASPTVVGMNSRGFDLPVIAARCLKHGISHPWYYATKHPRYRYAQSHHFDLQDFLSDHGAAPKCSLDVWARLIGWPGKGEIDGSDVPALLASGGAQAVADYCLSDVVQTAAVLLRVDLLRGMLSEGEYYAAANALLKTCEGDIRTAGLAAKVDPKRWFLVAEAEEAAE